MDPTDPTNYTAAKIVNNTVNSVVVDDCAGAYCSGDGPVQLAPGESLRVQGACGVSGADMTSWRVSGETAVLGYVAIRTPKSRYGVAYEVSQLSPDRATPSRPLTPGKPTR